MIDMMPGCVLLSLYIFTMYYLPQYSTDFRINNIVNSIPFVLLYFYTERYLNKYYENDKYYIEIIKTYSKIYNDEAKYAMIIPSRIVINFIFFLPLISLFLSVWIARLVFGYEPQPEPSILDLLPDEYK